MLLGQAEPATINVDEVVERFGHADNARAAEFLREIGFTSAIDLLSSYGGSGPDLAAWLKGAAINTDRDLRLQYLAGMGPQRRRAGPPTLSRAVVCAADPLPDLFIGSAEHVAELRNAIESSKPNLQGDGRPWAR